jgi:uncharacterized protein (DUF1800 family)
MLDNRLVETFHLMRRAGFGLALKETKQLATSSHAEIVTQLLTFEAETATKENDLASRLEAKKLTVADCGQTELQQAWLEVILTTPYPLQEKMALFWHNHFTSSISKVGDARLMLAQNRYFRRYGLGNFAQMVRDIARDPAMLLYLDGVENTKDNPNENFARELMELFTIGVGHYTEQDVREAARAFTGWQLEDLNSDENQPSNYRVYFSPEDHDDGLKSFMGHRGNFNGDDILTILLQKREVAYFVTRKLWEFLVYPDPADQLITVLGDQFYDNGYDLKKLVGSILLHPEFLSVRAYRSTLKSPVELVVGSLKALGGEKIEGYWLTGMGQALFAPPNVRGWLSGRHWLNSATYLARVNFAGQLLAPGNTDAGRLAYLVELEKNQPALSNQLFDELTTLLLDHRPGELKELATYASLPWNSGEEDEDDKAEQSQKYSARLRGVLHLIMSCPQYQLN